MPCSSLPPLVKKAVVPGSGSSVLVFDESLYKSGQQPAAFSGPPSPQEADDDTQLFYYYYEDDVDDTQVCGAVCTHLAVPAGAQNAHTDMMPDTEHAFNILPSMPAASRSALCQSRSATCWLMLPIIRKSTCTHTHVSTLCVACQLASQAASQVACCWGLLPINAWQAFAECTPSVLVAGELVSSSLNQPEDTVLQAWDRTLCGESLYHTRSWAMNHGMQCQTVWC